MNAGEKRGQVEGDDQIGDNGRALAGPIVINRNQHELSLERREGGLTTNFHPARYTKKGALFLRCEGADLMQDYLKTAIAAARAAGKIIRDRFGDGKSLSVRHKGRIDLVTEVDLACETELRARILDDWPEHAILGEEGGHLGDSQAPLWIVDPLDGTRSFAHGYPFVSVSVALEIEGQVVVGVVYDPLRDELFQAVRSGGAFLNDVPIHASFTETLDQALLVTGFPYHLAEFDSSALFGLFRDYVINSGGIRRDGSAAIDFCYIACGRLDGYWEFFLHPWDAAAGALIAQEAGAVVTNLAGEPYDIRVAEVLASNPHIHSAMIGTAAPYLADMRKLLVG